MFSQGGAYFREKGIARRQVPLLENLTNASLILYIDYSYLVHMLCIPMFQKFLPQGMIDRLKVYQNGNRMRAHLVCGTTILIKEIIAIMKIEDYNKIVIHIH